MKYPLKYPHFRPPDTTVTALGTFKARVTTSASKLAWAIDNGHLKLTKRELDRFVQSMGNTDAALERYLKRAPIIAGMKHSAHTAATVQSLKSTPEIPAWVGRDVAHPHVRRAAIRDLRRFEKDIRMGDTNVRLVLNTSSLDSVLLPGGPSGFQAQYTAHSVLPDGVLGPKVARVLMISPDFVMDFDNTYSLAFGINLDWYDIPINLEKRTEFASGVLRNFRQARELGFTDMSYLAGARTNDAIDPELSALQPPNGFRLELAARNPDAQLWDGPSSTGVYGISENQEAIQAGISTLVGPPPYELPVREQLLLDELNSRITNGELPSLREMAALGAPPGESSSELGTRLLRAIEDPIFPTYPPMVMERI